MKFKLKILKNINNPNDYYWKIVTLEEILYEGIKEEFFLIDGSYRFITKINDVEIYEYDCLYANNHFIYLFYSGNGMIFYEVRDINMKVTDADYITDYMMSDIEDTFLEYKFIGNWHDGEQYLLTKIKEIPNE